MSHQYDPPALIPFSAPRYDTAWGRGYCNTGSQYKANPASCVTGSRPGNCSYGQVAQDNCNNGCTASFLACGSGTDANPETSTQCCSGTVVVSATCNPGSSALSSCSAGTGVTCTICNSGS